MQLKPSLMPLSQMLNLPLRQTLVWFLGILVFSMNAFGQPNENVSSRYYYIGTLGKNLAIQMDISVTGEKVLGHYYYDKVGIPLLLSGNFAEIEEHDPKNRVTGIFRGTLSPLEKTFEGTWLTPNGKKRLPFKLTKVAEYVFSNTRQGQSLEVSAAYPDFLSLSLAWQQINLAVEQSFKKNQSHFMAESRTYHIEEGIRHRWFQKEVFSIEYYSEELISLLAEISDYSGGAHGNYYYRSHNFSINGDQAVELKLADLFLPNYGKVLSDYCLDSLRKQEASSVIDGDLTRLNDEDLGTFSLSPQGLIIHFAPYAVGSYAEGSFTVMIPYKDLKKVIDPNGSQPKLKLWTPTQS